MMKVTVNDKSEEKEIKYPCLMIHKYNKNIVLFCGYEEGMLIKEGEIADNTVGFISDNWNMNAFKQFNGSVTLEND